MATRKSQLIVELLDRVSGPARKVSGSLNGLVRTVGQANAGVIGVRTRVDAAITRNNQRMDEARGRVLDAAGAYYIFRGALMAPITAARELETAIALLGTKANLSKGQMAEVGKEARKAGKGTNQFALDVVKAQDFLVGMGLQFDKTIVAMPAIGKAATATKADILDLAKAGFAAISNLKVAPEQLAKSFDIMALAGKEGGFELRDMAQYLPAITGLGSTKGLSGVKGLADIVAALQIVRRTAGDGSEAATNFLNILQKMNAPGTVRKFQKLGININKELKKGAAKGESPIETLLKTTKRALKGDYSRLGELFEDAQVQKGLAPLLQSFEDYIALREKVAKAGNIIDGDFERLMETQEQQAKKTGVAFANLKTAIGTALTPILNQASNAIAPLLESLTGIVDANPGIVGSLIAITAGFVALRVSMAALTFLGLMGKGGLLSTIAFGLNTIGAAFLRLRAGATGALGLQAALAAMSGAKFGGLAKASVALRGMAMAIPGIATVGKVAALLTAPAWGAVAVGVGAVAAAGGLLYANWHKVSNFVSGFAGRIGQELAPVAAFFAPVTNAIGNFGSMIGSSFSSALGKVRQFGSYIASFFSGETLNESQQATFARRGKDAADGLINGIRDGAARVRAIAGEFLTAGAAIAQALADGIRSLGSGAIDWIVGKINSIASAARSAAGAIRGAFGGAAGSPSGESGSIGARARGGPISRGASYMVGEKGPELITAGRSGYVNKNRGSGGGGGGVNFSPVMNINASGNASAEDIGRIVKKVLEREVREVFRGVYSDTGMRFA